MSGTKAKPMAGGGRIRVAAVAAVTAVFALAATFRVGAHVPGDAATLGEVHEASGRALDSLMLWITRVGGPAAIVLAALLVGVGLILRRRVRDGLFVVGAVGVASVITAAVKLGVGRARPHVVPWMVAENGYSFPSGHATGSMALALAVAVLVAHSRRGRLIAAGAIGLAALVGFSRIYVGVHYPTDVIAGWLVAALTVMAGAHLRSRVDVAALRPRFGR